MMTSAYRVHTVHLWYSQYQYLYILYQGVPHKSPHAIRLPAATGLECSPANDTVIHIESLI